MSEHQNLETDTTEDVEGHGMRRVEADESADVEGHGKRRVEADESADESDVDGQ